MDKKSLFKLAIVNELLGEELHKIPINNILDNKFSCQIKNARKATNSLTGRFDELFGFKVAEAFGDFCGQVNKAIDDAINTIDDVSV